MTAPTNRQRFRPRIMRSSSGSAGRKIEGREEIRFWKGCKPNFVFALASGENHLSQQPVPGTPPPESGVGAGSSKVPYLALHPMGFSVPPRLRLERWALTPPFHPCPLNLKLNLNS